jgi:hypothetical protein
MNGWYDNMTPAFLGFLLAATLAVITLVVWLIRQEGKIESNREDLAEHRTVYEKAVNDLKKEYAEDMRELKDELKDTRERFFRHVADVNVHHNAEAVAEFRLALDRRLDTFEEAFKDISRKLNHMAGRT